MAHVSSVHAEYCNAYEAAKSPFICGAAVELHGLKTTAFNGSRGRVLSKVDDETTRCLIRVASSPPREARIKVENLKITPFTEEEIKVNAENEQLHRGDDPLHKSLASNAIVAVRPQCAKATDQGTSSRHTLIDPLSKRQTCPAAPTPASSLASSAGAALVPSGSAEGVAQRCELIITMAERTLSGAVAGGLPWGSSGLQLMVC